jgi:hypothetical protein
MIERGERGLRPILTVTTAAATACGALIVSTFIVGPIVRYGLGAPRDFNRDYVSREALQQALGSHGLTLALAFLLLGVLSKAWGSRKLVKWSLFSANPITIGLGYALYRAILISHGTAEYFGLVGWVWLSLLSPLLFAPFAFLGARQARGVG